MNTKSGKIIQSVQRAIDILLCFENVGTELSLAQISTQTGINKGTAHGILNTLYQNGFIRQSASGRYMLGPYYSQYISPYDEATHALLKIKAAPYMTSLANEYASSCSLFTPTYDALHLINLITPEYEAYTFTAHETQPLHCTASGKLLLALSSEKLLPAYIRSNPFIQRTKYSIMSSEKLEQELEKVRKNGYSVENEELNADFFSIAVPILNGKQKLIATLSVTGMASRLRPKQKELTASLLNASQQISKEMFS